MRPPTRIAFAAGLLAATVTAAACSGPPATSPGESGTPDGSTTSAPSTPGSVTPSASASTAPAAAKAVKIGKTIQDPALGHVVTVHQIRRHWPWPAEYGVAAEVFELVAIDMTWEPGTVYTAWLSSDMFTIETTSRFPNPTDSVIKAELTKAKLKPMPTKVEHGKSTRGWVVFKVEPKDAKKLTLVYTRPKVEVQGGETIPSKEFSLVLTK
jgi:hypothetical protein